MFLCIELSEAYKKEVIIIALFQDREKVNWVAWRLSNVRAGREISVTVIFH